MQTQLPKFPTDALPDVLRDWVEGEAHATQTPSDLAALGAISVCASRLARRVVIVPRCGWEEGTNIYAAVLLDPGNRKSAVFKDAMRPLLEIEKELIVAAEPEIAKAASRRRQAEERLKRLERELSSKNLPDKRHEADRIAEDLAANPVPPKPVLAVDDATGEKLAIILAEQGGRVMSASPEGGVFGLMAGRYSKNSSTDFEIYLKGHAGDDHTVHRVSRESVYIERATLTAFYAIQQEVIRAIGGNRAFRGRGLLGRFLWAAPESQIGRRAIGTEAVCHKAVENYHHAVRRIGDFEGEHQLTLTANASEKLLDWEGEIEAMLAVGGEMEHIRDWGAKLAGATLRIAAVLHCVERNVTEPIDAGALHHAIEIARYLIPHANYVLTELTGDDSDLSEQEKLLQWIRSRNGETSIKELYSSGPRKYRNRIGDADRALNDLSNAGLGEWESLRPGSQGGRPTRVFRLRTASSGPPERNLLIPPREKTGCGTETPKNLGNGAVSVPHPPLQIMNGHAGDVL